MQVVRRLLTLFLLASVIFALAGCGCISHSGKTPLLNEQQKKFLAMERTERIAFFSDADKRLKLKAAGDIPEPMRFRPIGTKKISIALTESTSEKLPSALRIPDKLRTATFDNGRVTVTVPPYVRTAWLDGTLYFCNFKLAQEYDLVETAAESGEELQTQHLVTESVAPRLLAVDNVPNVRDLGGRIGMSGRRVRQGLVYRSAGLNDNAYPEVVPVTEEILAREPWITPSRENVEGSIAALEAVNLEKVDDFEFNDKWVVFAPGRGLTEANCLDLANLTVVPETLMEMSARYIQLNAANRFAFPVPDLYTPSIFVKKFISDKDQVVRAGCSADWFFRVYLNGHEIYDALESGNGSAELVPADNPMLLPLKKGENMLVIPVLSGSASWTFCFGPVSTSPETIQKRQLANLRRHRDRLGFVKTGKMLPGKNRLNQAMQRYLVDNLGIRTDLDLRTQDECFGMTGSPLGSSVRWAQIPSLSYGALDSDAGRRAFAADFRIFLDEKNYPVLFHCIAGQDRTGSLAFILNGLLGVAEEELYRDWEASGFHNPAVGLAHHGCIDKLMEVLAKCKGETLQQKIENYVKSCGFSQTEIDKFRAIMLEPR